jgi:rabenosyn-5
MTRANLFLQKNMFPLQSIPKTKIKKKTDTPKPGEPEEEGIVLADMDSELAHQLQPLLEQEALLESFVEEAKRSRKFEDMKTLRENLNEIRREIERIVEEGERRGKSRKGKGSKG